MSAVDGKKGMSMSDYSELSSPKLAQRIILAALRPRDSRLTAMAIELIGRIGTGAVPDLVREACSRKNSPGHRVRLLYAVMHIGVVPRDADRIQLVRLRHDPNEQIRDAAARVIALVAPNIIDPAEDFVTGIQECMAEVRRVQALAMAKVRASATEDDEITFGKGPRWTTPRVVDGTQLDEVSDVIY